MKPTIEAFSIRPKQLEPHGSCDQGQVRPWRHLALSCSVHGQDGPLPRRATVSPAAIPPHPTRSESMTPQGKGPIGWRGSVCPATWLMPNRWHSGWLNARRGRQPSQGTQGRSQAACGGFSPTTPYGWQHGTWSSSSEGWGAMKTSQPALEKLGAAR